MNYYFFIPLGTFLFHFFIFTYVLAMDRKNAVNRAYLLFTGIMALWVLGCLIYYIPMPEKAILPSMKLLSLFWSFTGITFINFIYAYLKIKKRIIYYLIFLAGILSVVLTNLTPLVISDYKHFPWGQWIIQGPLYHSVVSAIFTFPVLYGTILLFIQRRKEKELVRYKQQTLIIFGIILNFIVGSLFEFIFPIIDPMKEMVRLTSFSTVILTGTFFYIIIRYRFLIPDIRDTAEAIFAKIQDAIIVVDPRGRVLRANTSARNLFDLDTVMRKKVYLETILPGYDYQKNYYNHEIEFNKKEEKRTLLLSQSVLDFSETRHGNILIIRDITEQRTKDQKLKNSEEQYRTLVETISEIIFEVSPDSIITYVSPAVTAATGHAVEDLQGRSIFELIHPEDIATVRENFRKYPRKTARSIEFRSLCADGSFVHFMSSGAKLVYHGDLIGYRGVLTNIEPQVRIRQKLQQTENLYNSIIHNITDIIWIMNIRDLSLSYISPSVESIFGWSPEECLQAPIKDRMTAESFSDAIAILGEELKNDSERDPERSRTINFTQIDREGNFHFTEASISFLRDEEGNAVEAIGITRDITERKKLQEEHEKTIKKLQERNDIIESDMKTAQLIQQALLPERGPQNNYLKSSYRYLPLEAVGGDYFNFIELREGGVGVFVADVVGHGIPAALFLSLLKSSTNKIWRNHALNPKEFMTRLNDDLVEVMSSYFITAIYGYFAEAENNKTSFTFSNGGHPPPIVYREKAGIYETIYLKGPLVGAFHEREYLTAVISMERGDRIFIFTDGLPETVNEKKQIIGFDNLPEFFTNSHGDTLDKTLDNVVKNVENFRDSEQIQDDMVLIGIEII